jgi:hypothetical protein
MPSLSQWSEMMPVFYLVTFPDFPEAATDGEFRHESFDEATETLEEAFRKKLYGSLDDLQQDLYDWIEYY